MVSTIQIEQMDVEVQGVPREHKTKLQVKLRSFKGEMARYKAEVVRAQAPRCYYPTLLLLLVPFYLEIPTIQLGP